MRFIEPPKSPEQETITMKQTLIRSLALLISAVMLIGLIPTAISAKEPATVKASGTTRLVLATQDFIDFNDNATLKMEFAEPMPLGEYVLPMTNISEDAAEQIGVWTSPAAPDTVLLGTLAEFDLERGEEYD